MNRYPRTCIPNFMKKKLEYDNKQRYFRKGHAKIGGKFIT